MSGGYPGGEGGQQQGVEGGIAGGGGSGSSCLPFYHVPQQCRREKLRYPIANELSPLHPYLPMPSHPLLHYHASHATASFVSPASSFGHLLMNPSCSSTSDPYDAGAVTAFNLLEPHALIGGDDVRRQGQGVSLSLSSSVAASHHNQSHHHTHQYLFGAPTLGGPQPQMPAAPSVRPVPAGPFTGYATILKGSRFLRPAQHLLEEVCCSGMGAPVGGGCEAEQSDFAAENLEDCQKIADGPLGGEYRRMKAKLVSMLDELYRRYKFYYQQIQAVLSSFEAVAGLNMAAPYAPLALTSLSRHFCCLKHQISDQIRMTDEAFGKESQGKNEVSGCGYKNGDLGYQRPGFSSCQANQQPVWRPQRGLPERAVSVLRAWLFEHFLHPYPSDVDKQMLAKQTGLSRNQVSNWFINARVRLWKPMVEEIHSLETRRALKLPGTDNDRSGALYPANEQARRLINASPPTDEEYPPPHKRLHSDHFAHVTNHLAGPVGFPDLDDVAAACRERGGVPMASGGNGNGGVSLTLGLHQSNGMRLPEPWPLNVVRRFGLDDTNGAWVGGQERQSSKEYFDGHLLRDFVA